MAEKIDSLFLKGSIFFQSLLLYLVLLTVKSYSVLQAIPHSSQPVSKAAGSLKFCLEKNIISRILLTSRCLTGLHRMNSIYDANSLCMYFVKKAAEIMVAYSEFLPETNALQLHSYHFGMV